MIKYWPPAISSDAIVQSPWVRSASWWPAQLLTAVHLKYALLTTIVLGTMYWFLG